MPEVESGHARGHLFIRKKSNSSITRTGIKLETNLKFDHSVQFALKYLSLNASYLVLVYPLTL